MHKYLLSSAAAILATMAGAQSPLTTTFLNNNGGAVGGGVYFDLTVNVPVLITGIAANVTGTGSVDVLTCPTTRVGNETNPVPWTLVGSGTMTGAVAGAQTALTGLPAFALAVGTYGVAFRGVGVSNNYTNGNGANQVYSTAELTLTAGAANNTAFTTAIFTPRVVNTSITYQQNGGGTVATRAPYGVGCINCPASFYEHFATAPAFDLNGSTIWGVLGAAYVFIPGAPYVAPTAAATTLVLGDDTETTVAVPFAFPLSCGAGTTSNLTVCSNGFISVATGNGVSFTPSPAAALAFPQTSWGIWHDFYPLGGASGSVKTELEGGSGAFVVTWDAVVDFATTSPNTWQMAFYPNGDVQYRVSSMSVAGGNFLVYYSPAGPSADPGNRDISATLPGSFAVCCTDILGLALAASARPVVGTNVTMVTSNVPAGAPFGAVLFGFTQFNPGISLAGIGMLGCFQYNDAAASFLFFAPGPTVNTIVGFLNPVPNFVGLHIQAQSAVYTGAPLAVSSNGVDLGIGNL